MHCKHCGNQIENDSKFCSFCGGKIEPIGQFSPTTQPLIQAQPESISTPIQQTSSSYLINSLLVIGLVNFGFTAFWIILSIIASAKEDGYKIYETLRPITLPLIIIDSSVILFLCFLYTKKKEHKTIFLILASIVIAWNIYTYYIKK